MVRLSLDSRKSRSRLRLLEKDETYTQRLIHVVGHLERTIEDAAVEVMDDPGNTLPGSADTLINGLTSTSSTPKYPSSAPGDLSPLQHKIVSQLNKLPNLKRELAFIDPVMNSHAVIIARDVKRFKHHELGQGVLQHLADNFVM